LALTANAVNNICFSVVTGALSCVVGTPGAGLVILYVMLTNDNAIVNVVDYRLTFNPYNANALTFTV
jgi:ABC-type Na+ transport system ATPase subunit NatA